MLIPKSSILLLVAAATSVIWDFNDGDETGKCITYDEGKDVYSIKRSGTNTGDLGFTEPNCKRDSESLTDFNGGRSCYSMPQGKAFKSFMINA
ncbi:hypothetical protein BJX70DRAFT_394170 [Aspergillus crustosus]